MTPTPRTALLATATLTVAALALAGCSTPGEAASGPDTATATDAGATIVASTAIWADVARAVDSDATVTATVENSNVDPHSFEPSAADLAEAAAADVAVANGGGYDKWFYDVVDDEKIIHALPLAGHEDEDGAHEAGADTVDGNEHIWYDTDTVAVVAEEIAAAVDGDASAIVAEMTELNEKIGQLPALRVAQTETVGDYIIDDSPMSDVTPDGYRQAQLNHGEPSAADLAAFLELIDAGGIDLLIYNPQTRTDLTGQLRDAADKAGIAIVEIGETPPEGTGFLDYFHQIVEELAAVAK